jgi:hypothetical protein
MKAGLAHDWHTKPTNSARNAWHQELTGRETL